MGGTVVPIGERQKARLEKRLGKRFAFLSVLGQGAAGTVFEVLNLHLNRKEALKVLADTQPENFSTRFSHEAKVSAGMDHPNIVKIYEFEQEKGSFWYSMQFIDGPSLAQIMAASRELDEVAMVRLAIPLLDALHYSHNHGVVHRDIKPGNILINKVGQPYLTDFGIAKTMDNLIKTRTGTMLGTPAYVAPEQAMGQAVDHRADIYSLGVTLYELVARKLPFNAESSIQTVVMRLKEDPEPLLTHRPDMRPELADIIMRALAREKEARWATAQEMKAALVKQCESLGILWDKPLMPPQDLVHLRKTLSLEESTIVDLGGDGPWQTVYDPPVITRLWRRIARGWLVGFAVAGMLMAGAAVWWTRAKPDAPVTTIHAIPAAEPSPAPAPAVPPLVPAPAIPPAARPVPVSRPAAQPPAGPANRRAVVPPMLEESVQPELLDAPGCGGITVNLSLRVSADGRVASSRVLSKVAPGCAKVAQEAGSRYRFKPALDALGQPVEGVVAVAIIFPEIP